ncbi:MAG: hypothetical protein HYT93_05220 [Parcubacteria group bacterium]|nr:hypothetical protein [Parcubacteria group bacterium]
MKIRRIAVLCVALLLAGCVGGGNDPPKIYHTQIAEEIKPNSVYYTEVKTSSDATLGVIWHVDLQGNSTVLQQGVDRAFWKDFTLALVGLGGQVGAAAVHGISFKAAKTAITNTVTTTNTNSNSGPCNETGGGDLTGC